MFLEMLLEDEIARRGLVDYRVRLREVGMDTTGLGGLGAAESNVKRFKRRLQGWRPELG